MGRQEEIKQQELWIEKHQDAIEPRPSQMQRKLEFIENEIRDIRLMLAGSPASKHWQEWKIKMDNLQVERKYHLYQMYGTEKYPRKPGDNAYSPPRDLCAQIPDI